MILAERIQTLQALTQATQQIPPNLAATIPLDQMQKIWTQMYSDYIWPQITARLPFEEKWDRLHKMYKVQRDRARPRQKQSSETNTINTKKDAQPEIADTIIFDTVDRLKNLNFFIAWKDAPVQYNRPRFISTPLEDQFYNPTTRKIKAANAILEWNNTLQNVRQKHLALAQHHYLYGVSFSYSDFILEIDADQSSLDFLLITNIGTTFEPISIRRLWLNPQLPIDQMEKQVCPFFFDLQVRGTILQNQYHPLLNPFGFVNLDKLNSAAYLFGQEAGAFTKGLPKEAAAIQTQMRPEFSGEALWTFYPFLSVAPGAPYKRYIVQCYANNLFSGNIIPLRIQEIHTPRKMLPLYGACHIPDLDSGLYTPSIAEILENHYDELVRGKQQYTLNKDLINNPPIQVMSGCPSANRTDLGAPGTQYEVAGVQDITFKQVFDGTQTTIQYLEQTRDQAQTSGKAVDAILGKAMGGRTTATEASNAFQASMSGVTSDVDTFCMGHYDNYARRVWLNTGRYIPLNLINQICGSVDSPPLAAEDLQIEIGIRTDVGSTFIESIVKQQHLQQAILSSTTSPYLDQAMLWKALAKELKMPEILDAVKDNGFEMQVSLAYHQAVMTYMGNAIAINPSQDHNIAIEVKTRFLQDTDSTYNVEMAANPSPIKGLTVTQYLSQQIQIHQQFIMLQMQQQLMQQQAMLHDEQSQRVGEQQHQLALKSAGPSPNHGQQQAGQPTQQPQPAPNQ